MAYDRDAVIRGAPTFSTQQSLAEMLGISASRVSQIKSEIEEREMVENLNRLPHSNKMDEMYDTAEEKIMGAFNKKIDDYVALAKPLDLLRMSAMLNSFKRRAGPLKEANPIHNETAIINVQINELAASNPQIKLSNRNEIIEVDNRTFQTASNAKVLGLADALANLPQLPGVPNESSK